MTKNLEEHEEPKKVFRNKKDERGIVIKNKARLVAQGYTQEEGIEYDEVIAHVARIEAIRLFLAYASFKDFVVYQMGVKSAFLYGKIEEEVYVCQPLGFEDPDFLDRVYKVEKALYALHQAPKAWYETLSTYLLNNGFHRGKIDKTLFIRRDKGDMLLVLVYVDDIIFGSTKKSLCTEFEKMMHKKFQMSSIASTPMETQKLLLKDEDGEEVDVNLYRSMIGSLMYLTSSRPDIMFSVCACVRYQVNLKVSHLHVVKRIFSDYAGASLDRKSTTGGCQFLGSRLISWDCNEKKLIQMVKIHTDKNVADLLTKAFDNGIGVNAGNSKLMLLGINLLLMGKVNAARHKLTAAEEMDFLNAHTIKYALTVNPMIFTSCIERFWATAKVKTVNGEVQLQALVNGKKIIVTEASVRRGLQLNDEEGMDYLPNATIFKELTKMGYEKLSQNLTFYTTFFSPQWKFLIHTILQCLSAKTTAWNEFSSTMASVIICLATNQKFNFSKYIFESMVKNLDNAGRFLMYPSGLTDNDADKVVYEERGDSLVRAATTATGLDAEQDSGNINKTQSKATPNKPSFLGTSSGGGPGRQETMGDTIAQTRSARIVSSDEASLGDQQDASKQGRKIDDIDKDAEITLVDETHGRHDDDIMFDVSDLASEEVFVAEQGVSNKDVNLSVDEVTLAKALAALKIASTRPKAKGLVIHEEEQATTPTVSSQQLSQVKAHGKGKGIMVEEPVKMKKKDQISLDEELAFKLQAKEEEEERLAREKLNKLKKPTLLQGIMCK
ncbi:putative ribonuclease H-like domain-containing protein [Tanacetum coccineum]